MRKSNSGVFFFCDRLFSNPAQTVSTPLSIARKRRTMQMDEVVRAVMSSSGVPISTGMCCHLFGVDQSSN